MKMHRRELLKAAATLAALSQVSFAARAAGADKLKIGMIGSGNVGSALGGVWAKAGHPVMFSSRTLKDDQALARKLGANVSAGTPKEAAAFGDVLVFAVPYGALPELGKSLASEIKGKILIDACNPYPARDGAIAEYARHHGVSVATAELLPGARFVRAFNAVGAAAMADAHRAPGKFGMPIVGVDQEAIDVASALIREIGYEPVLVGGLDKGRFLMPGTPLAGERSPAEVREIAASLQ